MRRHETSVPRRLGKYHTQIIITTFASYVFSEHSGKYCAIIIDHIKFTLNANI